MILLRTHVENKRRFGCYLCDCGSLFTSRIDAIKSGKTVSCGCYNKAKSTTHGLSKTSEYKAWISMIRRCYRVKDSNYRNYGARGITVCQQWFDFRNFIKDMGPKPSPNHSLDRKLNDRGYYPDNCKWSTRGEQQRNQRRTNYVEYEGQIVSLAHLARLKGLRPNVVWNRVYVYGWDVERAITEVPYHTH